MHKKVILKYVIISVVLITTAFWIGFLFSWLFDDENANKKVIFFLPVVLLWFGCLYFGILIQRLSRTKNILKDKFLGPLDLGNEKIINELGSNYKKKFPFILIFPLFIFLLLGFCAFKNNYKIKELSKFGLEKKIKIDSSYYHKGSRMIKITINHHNKNFKYNFVVKDSLKKNDTIAVVFSSRNPNIINLKSFYFK